MRQLPKIDAGMILAEMTGKKGEVRVSATPPPPITPADEVVTWDLYDYGLKIWFRGYSLSQLVKVAMLSTEGDKLELRRSRHAATAKKPPSKNVTPASLIIGTLDN